MMIIKRAIATGLLLVGEPRSFGHSKAKLVLHVQGKKLRISYRRLSLVDVLSSSS